MSQKLKIGVIGLGAIGPVHAEAYQANSGVAALTAFAELRPARLEEQAEKFAVPHRYTDYHELLASDIDAVSVCVPNAVHREIAVAALKAGKHVLLEKPMARNAVEALEIADAAAASGKNAQLAMVYRQAAEAQMLRQRIADGLLGEIYHVRVVLTRRRGIPGMGGWFTTKGLSGGGPLIDIGVHFFDVAMYISGLWTPTRVSAQTYAKFGPQMRDYKYVSMWAGPPNFDGVYDVEDYATGLVRFGAQATMNFEVSWAANLEDEGFIEILGDKGGVRVFDGKALCIRTEDDRDLVDLSPKFDGSANRFHRQAAAFLAACRGECPPAATVEQGVTLMRVLDAVYASSAQGQEVDVAVPVLG
jgi:predicted dehydrogenase